MPGYSRRSPERARRSPWTRTSFDPALFPRPATLGSRADPLRPRVTTNALRIALGFDGFHVRGSLHRQPSDSTRLVELFSNPATRSFFAVSDARIRHLFNSAYDTDVSLVLVNTKLLQFWALEGDD